MFPPDSSCQIVFVRCFHLTTQNLKNCCNFVLSKNWYSANFFGMKKFEIKFLKSYNAILAVLLALLGFSACDNVAEYGTPSATFIVQGKVESSDSNQPIQNIRVIMQGDTAFTDGNGNYKVMDQYGFPGDKTYFIQFQDIDGASNGEFTDLESSINFVDPEYVNGDGNWYSGEATEALDVKLDPKK